MEVLKRRRVEMLLESKQLWPTWGYQVAGLIEEGNGGDGILTFAEFSLHVVLFSQLRNHLENCCSFFHSKIICLFRNNVWVVLWTQQCVWYCGKNCFSLKGSHWFNNNRILQVLGWQKERKGVMGREDFPEEANLSWALAYLVLGRWGLRLGEWSK